MNKYIVNNLTSSVRDEFSEEDFPNAKELAEAKLIENRDAYLLQEANRFHIKKVIRNDLGEVWSDADLNNDPEIGEYQSFDHTTGSYDAYTSLTEAKQDSLMKKEAFIVSSGLDKILEIDITQPVATGLNPA